MKRELIITIIIIIAIIVGGNITLKNTEKVIGEVDNRLNNLKDEILTEEKENVELTEELNNIYDDWGQKEEILSVYLEHDELEKVNIYLMNIKGFLEADDAKTGLAELESCMAILKHIEDKQAINIKNIF